MSLEGYAYEQNYQQFRSLNQIMWQVPVLAMTLTGGLWFGVSKIDDNKLLTILLLLTAAVGNITLSLILYRFRFVMQRYLEWLRNAHPSGYVDASEPDQNMHALTRLLVREENVRRLFSFLLIWAAGVSFLLLVVEVYAWGKDISEMQQDRSIEYYENHARVLADSYEAVSFEDAYPFLVSMFSGAPLDVLDIGSGTGRDAAWLAAKGHRVVAVEPSPAMRSVALSLHKNSLVRWLSGRLPELQNEHLQSSNFDVILVNAVWMHLPAKHRAAALARIRELLRENGKVFVSLRLGPQNKERGMYEVVSGEFEARASKAGFSVIHRGDFPDLLGRPDVSWKMFELQH